MKKNLLTLSLSITSIAFTLGNAAAIDYVALQNLGTNNFTVDSGSDVTYLQDGTSITMSPNVALGTSFYSQADMSPAQSNWSIYTTFYVKMNITGTNPNLPFTLTVSDAAYANTLGTMSGYTTWDNSNGGGIAGSSGADFYALLTPASPISAFQGVKNLQMGWDGSGNINVKVSQVAGVVPEPSTYALLGLSALALGSHLVRRRRRA